MNIAASIIFWTSILLLVHSYLFYPLILWILARKKTSNQLVFFKDEILPNVAIILAAHNEEQVMNRKIESIFNTTYPIDKIKLYIGSDCSEDKTNQIIQDYETKYPIQAFYFPERKGKAQIINILSQKADAAILIQTDANVFFDEQTIFELVKHFKNPEIGLVGGNIVNSNFSSKGISFQERSYLINEKLIKYRQGVIWKHVIGAFGGCYAIRKANYKPVPKDFLMDDFFITLSVIQQNKQCITEPKAKTFEDVSDWFSEEFRRKVRISIGNFQNLVHFRKMYMPPFSALAFSFLSHKIIRWVGPLLLILILIMNLMLIKIQFYQITFYIFAFSFLFPLVDFMLKKINMNAKIIRFITHFYGMNLALLIGFFKYIKGVKTNVWQPTKREQSQ